MRNEEKLKLYFEKCNSKYNRLYGQLTNIGIFTLSTIILYMVWRIPYQYNIKTIEDALILEQVTQVYAGIWILLAFIIGVLLTNLIISAIRVHIIIRENRPSM